jgi:hypothetical protein
MSNRKQPPSKYRLTLTVQGNHDDRIARWRHVTQTGLTQEECTMIVLALEAYGASRRRICANKEGDIAFDLSLMFKGSAT